MDIPAHIRQSPSLRAQHARRLAEAASTPTGPHGAIVGTAYDLLRAQLAQHQATLRSVQSLERKAELKREYLDLPCYMDWIKVTLAQGKGAQDDVFVTLMVWAIDACRMGLAALMAEYVIKHGLTMPDRFERSAPAVLAEEFAGVYLGGRWPQTEPPAYTTLDLVRVRTEPADMHDQIRAKLYKAMGYACMGVVSTTDSELYKGLALDVLQTARPLLARALELFDGVGVKKDLERIDRAIRQLTKADDTPSAAPAA